MYEMEGPQLGALRLPADRSADLLTSPVLPGVGPCDVVRLPALRRLRMTPEVGTGLAVTDFLRLTGQLAQGLLAINSKILLARRRRRSALHAQIIYWVS